MTGLPPTIGQLSLGSPWMLIWGAVVAIPVLIHLLSRRTRFVTSWAAMEFLQSALRKNARRLQVEQLLLLALRMLLLVLLAAALAEPVLDWIPVVPPSLVTRGRTHTIVVIDGSYSMGLRAGGRDLFSLAQEQARELVAQGRQGDGFSLVVMADPPQTSIGDVAFDPNDVQQEIDNLVLTHGGAPLAATLDEVQRILEAAAARHPGLTEHRVCFFSDLGRTTWDEVVSDSCRQRLSALADRATIILVESEATNEANLAVTRFVADSGLPVARDQVALEIEIQNFGHQEADGKRIELLVDGSRVAERFLSIAAAGRSTTSFSYRFDTPGEHVLVARVSDDGLALDNQRWLSLPVRESLRVLCIQGKQEAAKYVALALAPQADEASRIQPEVVPESALAERDLSAYDCVWLCNVGRFDREEASLLDRYVQQGGVLIVALGDQVQTENYNRELGDGRDEKPLLPARLGQMMGGGPHALDPLDYQHPVLFPFRGHERAGLLTTPVWRYIQLSPYDSEHAEIALAFASGDPLIVSEAKGQGVVYVLATAVSLASQDRSSQPVTVWTGLPSWPSFPPLVHTLVQVGTRGRVSRRNVMVGEPISAAVPAEAVEAVVTVTTPEQRQLRVPVRVDESDRRWHFASTWISGVYGAEFGPDVETSQEFAVNPDTGESDLSRFERAALPVQFEDRSTIDEVASITPDGRNGWPLFRSLLAAMVAVMLAETLLAWRFGGAA